MKEASHKDHILCDSIYNEMSVIVKSIETESILVVVQEEEIWKKWGVTANGYGVTFLDEENVLKSRLS